MFKDDCHLFVESDASWIYKTRQSAVTVLNPIQFELLLERCHITKNSQNEIHPTPERNQTGDDQGNLGGYGGYGGYDTIFNPDSNSTLTDTGNMTDVSPIVYPGTKWCGRGDIASNYDDLGIYAETDRCCRDHDNCPDNILAGEEKHGLLNQASFTSSHCDCDEKFLDCLRNDHTLSRLTSSKIAYIYFNVLKPLCFDERHPVKACQRQRLTGECIRPEYDYRQGRQWQFFAAQPYFAKTVRGLLDTFSNVFLHSDTSVPDPSSQSGRRSMAMPPGFTF